MSTGSIRTKINNMPIALHPTQLITDLPPPLITNTRITPQHVIRVNGSLDLDETLVVASPELVLPVPLVRICLGDVSNARQRRLGLGISVEREREKGRDKAGHPSFI
jgi:hypothetical protein